MRIVNLGRHSPLEKVRRSICYLDTVDVQLRRRLLSENMQFCRALQPSLPSDKVDPSYAYGWFFRHAYGPAPWGQLKAVVRDCTWQRLNGQRARVTRLHAAYDLITDTQEDAEAVMAFFLDNARQTNPTKAARDWVRADGQAAVYARTQAKSPKRNIAVYSSRASKITGQPCVHIEFRMKGKAAISRLVRQGQELTSVLPASVLRLRLDDLQRFVRNELVAGFDIASILPTRYYAAYLRA